ncbi:MAG: integrase core domain-containing protein, partial [Planctomycetota bacterium]|nr:integrase core domain-containing protein [Planctomycetota bacterium]MDA1165420.1 integrase core domain-containing protein [Planctomycetota bacterium]
AGREQKPAIVMHDRDTKFTKEYTAALAGRGVRTNPLPVASPNLNGRCERFIQTIKLECLGKFIVFGKRHLDHLVTEFTEYYNTARSSMVRGHLPPVSEQPEEVGTLAFDEIEIRSYVGGLVKGFGRRAA